MGGWYQGKKYTNDLEYIKPKQTIGRCGLCGDETEIKKQATYEIDGYLETIKLCYRCSVRETWKRFSETT